MIIKNLNGYYIFEETTKGQVADFMKLFGVELVRREGYFTFPKLAQIPKYSLKGKAIGESLAIKTFAGEPWEVFEANGLVYDFANDVIVPIDTITYTAQITDVGDYLLASGLLVSGTFNQFGVKVKSFMGWHARNRTDWLYSEVDYV